MIHGGSSNVDREKVVKEWKKGDLDLVVGTSAFGLGINYKPGIWHFPLISTEDMNFLVIDRKGKGKNLIIHKFKKERIYLSR